MSAVLQSTCSCGSIGASGIRLCEDHHRYWLGDKELASVTKVLKSTWPLKPDFSAADPHTLEHARERGVRVDKYVSEYLRSGRLRVPAGEWEEVVQLVQSFCLWWKQDAPVKVQQILHDDEIAGTCDVLSPQVNVAIWDVKCTYDIEATYPIQLGGYADLYEKMHGVLPAILGVIQIHKRFPHPQVRHYDTMECVRDWRILRETWRMVQRRKR